METGKHQNSRAFFLLELLNICQQTTSLSHKTGAQTFGEHA